jgi:hypothetical protein
LSKQCDVPQTINTVRQWEIGLYIAGSVLKSEVLEYSITVKQSRYRLEWPRGFQEFKVPRLHDNGTG